MEFSGRAVIQGAGDVRSVSFGDDSKTFVEFYLHPEYQEFLSQQGGLPIYKDVIYVLIQNPGSRDNIRRRAKMEKDVAGDSDMQRFPRQWAAFENQQEQVQEGLPLTEWAFLTKAEALNFKARGVHTVEALSDLSDAQCQGFGMGITQLREKARDTLKAKEKDGVISLIARIDRLEREIRVKDDLLQQAMSSNLQPHPALPNPPIQNTSEESVSNEPVSLISARTLQTLNSAEKKKSAVK